MHTKEEWYRLNTLKRLDVLEEVVKETPHFVMNQWAGKTDCGTHYCAWGSFAASTQGEILDIMWVNSERRFNSIPMVNECLPFPVDAVGGLETYKAGLRSAARVFGLSEEDAEDLFGSLIDDEEEAKEDGLTDDREIFFARLKFLREELGRRLLEEVVP